MTYPRIVIAGAGNIGCFVGGLLAAAGRPVVLLGRERIARELREYGLQLTDWTGMRLTVGSSQLALSTDPEVLAGADLVLVTTKSGDTEAMADLVARHAPTGAAIVSLQNGVDNPALLRRHLPGRTVIAGMVPFNVVALGNGRFHRGTSGELAIEAGHPDVAAALRVPHLPIDEQADMVGVQWGKLLLNLNNALNALSGLTLHRQLLDRRWRAVLADQQDEALALLAIAGIRPWSMGPLPARLLPTVLRLPTPLFRLLARSAVRIDRTARSSMWDDLQRGRATEIEELQGAVVRLAERLGRSAPISARVRALVREAEAAGRGSPGMSPGDVPDQAG